MTTLTNQQIAMRVSRRTMAGNLLLSAFKFLAGVLACSSAMLSDAVHSASDVLSTVVVMIGVKAAGKAPDKSHPYGHERLECVAALILSAILLATGVGIGAAGVGRLLPGRDAPSAPGALALWAAGVSIVVKEAMYWYTRAAAKKIHSGAVMADAWHHRSDALSSIGSFAGILGARMGFPLLDPIAGLVICLFIIKAALDIFLDAVSKLTDRACGDALVGEMESAILSQEGVLGIDSLTTRLFGDRAYVDVEIRADPSIPLLQAHDTAQRVHDAVEQRFPVIKHCMVHVNPDVPRRS